MAVAQAHEARDTFAGAIDEVSAPDAVALTEISTTGDQVQDRALAELGGKGLFAKELDAALLDGRIDVGVHSLKDLETALPEGTVLGACLAREDPRDALICAAADSIDGLPRGAAVGTASLRRQAQLLHRRPDLKVVLLRGNVQTRLAKIAAGEADLYPRLGPTSEWDIAAGHAVLSAAGGSITQIDGAPFVYGKDNIRNPHFLAKGR